MTFYISSEPDRDSCFQRIEIISSKTPIGNPFLRLVGLQPSYGRAEDINGAVQCVLTELQAAFKVSMANNNVTKEFRLPGDTFATQPRLPAEALEKASSLLSDVCGDDLRLKLTERLTAEDPQSQCTVSIWVSQVGSQLRTVEGGATDDETPVEAVTIWQESVRPSWEISGRRDTPFGESDIRLEGSSKLPIVKFGQKADGIFAEVVSEV